MVGRVKRAVRSRAGTLSCGPADLGPGGFTRCISVRRLRTRRGRVPRWIHASVTTTNDGSDSASAWSRCVMRAIDIAKVADNTSVSAGDQIGFTLTVTNNGTGTARNVRCTDLLPTDAGLQDWSIDGPAHRVHDHGRFVDCGPADLGPGGSYTVHISSPTTRPRPAARRWTTPPRSRRRTTAPTARSASVQVRRRAIDIAKVADNPSVSAGDQIGFTLTVTNNGTGTAQRDRARLAADRCGACLVDRRADEWLRRSVTGTLDCGPADLAPGGSYRCISSRRPRRRPGQLAGGQPRLGDDHERRQRYGGCLGGGASRDHRYRQGGGQRVRVGRRSDRVHADGDEQRYG